MHVRDAAAKETAVARFLREYPQVEHPARGHSALSGCADVDRSRMTGCPAGIPVVRSPDAP